MTTKIIAGFLVIVMAIFLLSCTESETAAPPADQSGAVAKTGTTPSTAAAQPAAERSIVASAFDLDNNLHDLRKWIGKQPVVVNFWGTWCPPCRREIPDLVRIYEEYKPRGVEIISLAVNDTPDKARAYASRANMTWVMLMYDKAHRNVFDLSGSVPTTIFYDKDGNEVTRFIGLRSYNTLKQAFESIVDNG